MADSNLHELSKHGQSVWIDYLSRDMLEEGELARMMREDAVVGVTSNPTIFQKAISHGDRYDDQLRELLEAETDPKEIFLQLSARDIEAALDLLAPVHEQTGYDGFVSWEVDPTLAYDREGTFDEAMRLHAWLDRPNLYVKIPTSMNTEYRGVRYVEELIGPETVNTMPEETIRAFQDHGDIRGDTVAKGLKKAHALLDDIAKVGVDYDDVTETLELEGVQKIADSFSELLAGVTQKREALA